MRSKRLLVEKRNPVALARAIEQLLNDANLRKRLSEAARHSISSYSPEAYYDSILSLYQGCLVGKYELSNS